MGVSTEVYRSRIGSHHNLLKYILFSLSQKPIEEGKKQQRSVPVVCTNDVLSCCLCAITT